MLKEYDSPRRVRTRFLRKGSVFTAEYGEAGNPVTVVTEKVSSLGKNCFSIEAQTLKTRRRLTLVSKSKFTFISGRSRV